jgi:hypothetical protein
MARRGQSFPWSAELQEALEEVHARIVLVCERLLLMACSPLADEHMPRLALREQAECFVCRSPTKL